MMQQQQPTFFPCQIVRHRASGLEVQVLLAEPTHVFIHVLGPVPPGFVPYRVIRQPHDRRHGLEPLVVGRYEDITEDPEVHAHTYYDEGPGPTRGLHYRRGRGGPVRT